MARVVKEEAYAQRRLQIVEAAQKLMYTKGYELMSIQDILDELNISKGAFYHYFDSKQALLEAVVERMEQDMEPLILSVVQAPNLAAVDKFMRFFEVAGRWKTEHKAFVLSITRMWYADENAVLRQKLQRGVIRQFAPLLSVIVRQGVQEGQFTTPYPDQAGEMVFALQLGLGDTFVEILLGSKPHPDDLPRARLLVAAYTDAMERLLGAQPGSLVLMDDQTLQEWVSVPATLAAAAS